MEMSKPIEILDLAVVKQLREIAQHSDPDLFNKLVDLYQQDCIRYVTTIQESIAGLDLNNAKRAAHALKSASSNMGAFVVAENCLRLEQHVTEQVNPEVIELAKKIQIEYGNACQALQQLCEGSA